MPITAIRWRPAASNAKTKNILIALAADGAVLHWHATSGKVLHQLKLDTQTLCLDYDYEGKKFALGCNDMNVRIYDESTKDLVTSLAPGWGETLGHSNRIQSVKFVNENTLVSGGWDNNILIWDLRSSRVTRAIYGPHIAGDSIDAIGNILLAGGYQLTDQLQMWKIDDGSPIHTENLKTGDRSCMIYTAQFSKVDCGAIFALGGAGSDEAYFYETATQRPFAVLNNLTKAVYSIDFANTSNRVAVGSGDGSLRLFNVNRNSQINEF